jgi:hypothetical protein
MVNGGDENCTPTQAIGPSLPHFQVHVGKFSGRSNKKYLTSNFVVVIS